MPKLPRALLKNKYICDVYTFVCLSMYCKCISIIVK